MSANDEVIVRRKQNGLYEVRHAFVDDLIHTLAGVEPSIEDLTIKMVADDIDGQDKAIEKANNYLEEMEDEGQICEYGLRIF